nr:unnamed protein product [Digitaria exilis]
MSNKRRGHDGQNQHAASGDGDKRPRRGKHLYLLLDDWDRGFSIHKIDADCFVSDNQPDRAARHLPEPPVLRLASPVGPVPQNGVSFAALGTKIFALMSHRCGLVYDTETAVLAVGAHAPSQMVCGFGITVAIGEMLYALSYRFFDKQHSFEVLSWETTAPDATQQQRPTEGWSWRTLPSPPPAFHSRVNSYVLHPDRRTIFMTTANKGRMGTYSFDTMDSEWRWHGEWALPFIGQGHFDDELDVWVGLYRDGSICACRVASPSCHGTVTSLELDCKKTKEKLFRNDDDAEMHLGATLTYMGASRFCLVQCVAREGVDVGQALLGGCAIHLTVFGVKYSHRGELQITDHRSRSSFLVSRHKNHFGPVAFWM